jgi:hypothetical protein
MNTGPQAASPDSCRDGARASNPEQGCILRERHERLW